MLGVEILLFAIGIIHGMVMALLVVLRQQHTTSSLPFY